MIDPLSPDSHLNKNRANGVPRFGKFLPNAIVIAALALLVILFSSALFATLGFEYSALMGIALSFFCGVKVCLNKPGVDPIDQAAGTNNFGIGLSRSISEGVALATIPLMLSIISLIWLSNCSFWDGLLFYFEVAYPSAILGSAFGFAFGYFFHRRRIALLAFTAFWIGTLVLSLLPGYFNPQLFTYGWQYGFFPGFVWDEALELTSSYLFARVEHVIWAAMLLSAAYTMRKKRAYAIPAILFVACLAFYFLHDNLGITTSQSQVKGELSREAQVDRTVWIEYDPRVETTEEIERTLGDVRWYLHDIRERFQLHEQLPIHVYIYPDIESLKRFIGTRSASIAKPWLGEVHIAKGNLPSLKHELTHLLLKEKAGFPFYASWSTGLTEGAAMSVEPRYDGLFTPDEHAARILQMKFADGVKGVMAFTGFASNASGKSYVLAGSFTRYLIRSYGVARFNRLYSSLSYEKEYGKPLDSLEAEWKRSLAPYQTPLSTVDSARFRYFYDRSSIVFNGCLRRIGKLQERASEAYRQKRYSAASSEYEEAVQEGAGIGALAGEADALIQQHKIREALALLDTTHVSDVIKQKPALMIEQADLCVILGDSTRAAEYYQQAAALKLSASSFLTAYSHQLLSASDIGPIYRQYLNAGYLADSSFEKVSDSLMAVMLRIHAASAGFDRVRLLLQYLRAVTFERRGELRNAVEVDPFLDPMNANTITAPDSLAIYLMGTHMRALRGGAYEDLCPVPYRNTALEYNAELRKREEWERSAGIRPYHAAYR